MLENILTSHIYSALTTKNVEQEINEMILALITPDKSALLVGKPGIGKTAIVEGLGYRINIGQAPDALKGWNIIKINIPSLLGSSKTEEGNISKYALESDKDHSHYIDNHNN